MKVAILGQIHKDGLDFLERENFEILHIENFEENNLITNLSEVEGIVIRTAKLMSNVLSHCKILK